MSEERFSRRFGHRPEEREITVREDAPEDVRAAILKIAESDLDLRPSYLRDVLCTVLRKLPDRSNWSEYPNVWEECQCLIEDCPWYKVYDFVEMLYRNLRNSGDRGHATRWQDLINDYFLEAGVGWRMVDGLLESRGPEAFVTVVDAAQNALNEAKLPTARQEIHEALRDLSRRPEPDLTGAIQHAMAALECTAREATGDIRATLGEVLKRYPDLLPKPIDEAASRLWGYASEMARHLREGRAPARPEAELLVGAAAALCTYLAEKIRTIR
jgi:hypothetical protein